MYLRFSPLFSLITHGIFKLGNVLVMARRECMCSTLNGTKTDGHEQSILYKHEPNNPNAPPAVSGNCNGKSEVTSSHKWGQEKHLFHVWVKRDLAKGRDCIPKGLECVQEVCRSGLGHSNSGNGGLGTLWGIMRKFEKIRYWTRNRLYSKNTHARKENWWLGREIVWCTGTQSSNKVRTLDKVSKEM